MKTINIRITLSFFIFSFILSFPSVAEKKSIFDQPNNLKVLDKNISADNLRKTMKMFSMGLGVRCQYCHVGEPGKPLATYDFSSDDKENKHKTRVMIKMLNEINHNQIEKLREFGTISPVKVTCMTCHRGQNKPKLIEQVLKNELDKNGGSGVVKRYQILREKYYGSHTFDFNENVIPMFAQSLLSQPEIVVELLPLLEMNQSYYPDSFSGLMTLATAYEKTGKTKLAITTYRAALAVKPKASFIQRKINNLTK